ncbi:MAG: undecaprenyl/decaprenyl-phosphate alpha-N-acetylglucosaminyl 1-phosphate transferase, partial [Planctomycetaceae bacterium]|nr:undecaprenyl/decaprenyl-phosphate alpha-N-acetylglucosaminyl 1-phosphate transferase [Planctomycetaceae bacterium]
AAVAAALIPYCRFALRFGLADYPDRFRKLHRQPVPIGGAVLAAAVILFLPGIVLFRHWFAFPVELTVTQLLPLLIAAGFITAAGLIDDKWRLNGSVKLCCQVLAAFVITSFTNHPTSIIFFGLSVDLHHLFYPLAVFWLAGMVNSINLLDGADGVAAATSFFLALSAALIACINGHYGAALCSFCLAGCLVGFFLHNCPPASVYLGDTGSMFIGLVLGTLLLQSCAAPDGAVRICAPLAAALIPAVDVFFAIIRRINMSRPVFSPDRGHLHHLLYTKFSSEYLVLLFLVLLVFPGCAGAVAGTYYQNDSIPLVVSAAVLGIALVNDLFGRQELRMLFGRVKNIFRKRFNPERYIAKDGETYQIQGKGGWKPLWHRIVSTAKKQQCRKLCLMLNMPYRGENFFGNWENPESEYYETDVLVCRLDLAANGRSIGMLYAAFDRKNIDRRTVLRMVTELAADIEQRVAAA